MDRFNPPQLDAFDADAWLAEHLNVDNDPQADRAVKLARLAAGIEADLLALGPQLDVRLPRRALTRTKAAVWAASGRRRIRPGVWSALAATAAAAALILLTVHYWPVRRTPSIAQQSVAVSTQVPPIVEDFAAVAEAMQQSTQQSDHAQALAQIHKLEMALVQPSDLAAEIDQVNSDLEALESSDIWGGGV